MAAGRDLDGKGGQEGRPQGESTRGGRGRRRGGLRVRWGRVGLLLALAASTTALLWVYFQSGVFSISEVKVSGNRRLDPSYLVSLSGIGPQDNLITFDRGAAKSRLEEEPWVRRATIRKHFPDCVELVIEEREPVAQVGGLEEYFLVDGEGFLVECAPQPWSGYPLLELPQSEGLEVSGRVTGDAFAREAETLFSMDEGMRARAVNLRVDEQKGISVLTTEGIVIYLGGPDDLPEKLKVAFAIMDDAALRKKYPRISYIDVSSPNDPVISPM